MLTGGLSGTGGHDLASVVVWGMACDDEDALHDDDEDCGRFTVVECSA